MSNYDERLEALNRQVELQATIVDGLASAVLRGTMRMLALVRLLTERGHVTASDLERLINEVEQDATLNAEFSSDPTWTTWRNLRRTIQEVQGEEPREEQSPQD
jgi:hypothetical protein